MGMKIIYTDKRVFSANDIKELFQSVGWLSANYPERVKKALDNCETVFTAWDGGYLVGLIISFEKITKARYNVKNFQETQI